MIASTLIRIIKFLQLGLALLLLPVLVIMSWRHVAMNRLRRAMSRGTRPENR